MKLPHLYPIKFATKVITQEENRAKVVCNFPTPPTLPMLIEACAQATSALSKSDTLINGFLVLIKDASLWEPTLKCELSVVVEKRLSLGNSCEFYFEVFEEEAGGKKIANGTLMLVLE